jgi:flagellar basal body-associated protein FliL
MKSKNVFYLCLITAIIFFALGGMAYSWLLAVGIGIGIYIGKILFWAFLIGVGILIMWLMFHKKNHSQPTETQTNQS